ncbi:ATP-binding cassette domain-containing protein [Ketogulonicigenium vulgare]|uniref:ATP-binding cassette domain-containing protein n=1 Tax=Ketogulonicigenium vulgare TaxID=92945 RepID=UPI002359608E|nr:ABC transporter ATP-binding protein [Ketogulonicigenium vulgare]
MSFNRPLSTQDHIAAGPQPPRDSTALLQVTDLHIGNLATGEDQVRGVSFSLHPRQVIGIVGESGSGKTLTCRAILGILPQLFTVSAGQIALFGKDAAALTPKQWTALRGLSLTAIFQDPGSYLNPSVHVGPQIAETLRLKRGLNRLAANAHALQMLRDVRLHDPERVFNQYPFELSGGMLQRVLIAAAISLDPQILIADEVTTALDVTVQAEVLDLLVELKDKNGLALIVISHDLAVVAQICDEVLVMRAGEVVEHGPTRQVLHHPRHSYTKLLISEHAQYGLERFLDGAPDLPRGDETARDAIAVTGLSVSLGQGRQAKSVLHGIDLRVTAGSAVGIIGETGSGKTTLARTLVGLVQARAGQIRINGEEVTAFTPAQWRDFRRRGVIQYVFQDPLRSLDPEATIAQSLAEPLLLRGLPRAQIDARIAAQIQRVDLAAELLQRFPAELSGGQRQRVLLARALVTAPAILVLDEPVSALDAANRVQVLEILNALRAGGTTLVFISHDLGSVAGVTDRVAVLYRGRIVEYAPTPEVINRPQHPYTRLLVGSAPVLNGGSDRRADRAKRQALRRALEQL